MKISWHKSFSTLKIDAWFIWKCKRHLVTLPFYPVSKATRLQVMPEVHRCLCPSSLRHWSVMFKNVQAQEMLRQLLLGCTDAIEYYMDVACYYRWSNVVCLSVGLSISHGRKRCKNCQTNWNAVWDMDSGGPKEACVRWGCILAQSGEYDRTIRVRWQCGLMSNSGFIAGLSNPWKCLNSV